MVDPSVELEEIEAKIKTVPGVCSKAPLKDLYLNEVRKKEYDFTQRDNYRTDNKSIIVTQGRAGKGYQLYPEEANTVAVTLRHVWSGRGWWSNDMKDYLSIPDNVDLMLLTTMHDDILERAWDNEVMNDDLEALGFDVWHPLDFSCYSDMSRFNNIWLQYRTLYSQEASKSHFAIYPGQHLDYNQIGPDDPFVRASEAAPNLLVHLQSMNLRKQTDIRLFRQTISDIKKWQKRLKVRLSLFFMGVTSPEVVFNLKRNFPDNDCYFMAVSPWLAAHKGAELTPQGKSKKSNKPKSEIILINQRSYATLVNDAISAASKSL